ncbi:MAG TPA: transposase, partial [Vicinamibacterales bacterium]|nr:transposase [Vicinamibacterales bacterium]
MSRDLRLTYPGAVHHVMARSNDQRQLFVDDEDRNEFVERMAVVREMYEIEWRTYVLMNTHFHAKLKTPHANLAAAMQYLLSHFAKWWNRRRSRRGHLLEARYKAPLIEGGWYSGNVIRYIALNPVKANYVEHAADWRWGSHRALAG